MNLPVIRFLLSVVTVRLITFLVMSLPVTKTIPIKFFKDLFSCDLCLGVWVSLPISLILDVNLFTHSLGYFLTAGILAYLSHVFFLGVKFKHFMFEVSDGD